MRYSAARNCNMSLVWGPLASRSTVNARMQHVCTNLGQDATVQSWPPKSHSRATLQADQLTTFLLHCSSLLLVGFEPLRGGHCAEVLRPESISLQGMSVHHGEWSLSGSVQLRKFWTSCLQCIQMTQHCQYCLVISIGMPFSRTEQLLCITVGHSKESLLHHAQRLCMKSGRNLLKKQPAVQLLSTLKAGRRTQEVQRLCEVEGTLTLASTS